MKTRGIKQRKARGFTTLEMIVVIAVGVLLAGLILPRLARTNRGRHYSGCYSNLQQIGLAARMWSNDTGDVFPWAISVETNGTMELVNGPTVSPHFLVMSNEMNSPKILTCPTDLKRTRVALFSEFDDTHLSYFVGVDSSEASPQSILSGDRNITGGVRVTNRVFQFTRNSVAGLSKDLHNQQGYIALSDGSVKQVSPDALGKHVNAALLSSGQPALRLAIP